MDKNNERYARKDIEGGYLYNKSEINYFRQVQNIEIATNLMLGDYNQNGNYTIDASVIEQLVGITKVYQYSFGSTMFCQSLIDIDGFGKIDFAIKILKDAPTAGYTTAILELLESIDKANGYYTNTNTVQIKKYTAKETSSFVIDVLKEFNVISKKDSGLVLNKKDEKYDLILLRKKYEQMRKNLLESKVEEIYKTSFNKKMRLLSKSAEGRRLVDEFNKATYKLNGWFVKEDMKGYYKVVDEILQSLIESHKPVLSKDVDLIAGLNRAQNDCAKQLQKTIQIVDNTMVNRKLYGENASLLIDNQAQQEIQKKNQNAAKVGPAKKQEQQADKDSKKEEPQKQEAPKKEEPEKKAPAKTKGAPVAKPPMVGKPAGPKIAPPKVKPPVVAAKKPSAMENLLADDEVIADKKEQLANFGKPEKSSMLQLIDEDDKKATKQEEMESSL